MARDPKHNDFTVDVPDIGKFTFARRTIRDDIACGVKYAEMSAGAPVDAVIHTFITAFSALEVLTVSAPADWNLEELDAFDDGAHDRLLRVWGALSDKEKTFRTKQVGPASGGEGDGGDARVLVPPDVQPPAE